MSHRIKRVVGEPDVVHPFDHGMRAKELRYLARVLYMPLDAESKRLNSLQEQEAVKGRQRGPRVALTNRAAARNVRRISVVIDIDDAVISNFRTIEHVELLRMFAPGKFAAIDNHAADTGAAPSNEFRHGVHDH